MIIDARRSETRLDRHADVVVVGAGPAGVVLGRELAGCTDVLLIEAGGDTADAWLLEAETAGIAYDLAAARARRPGGSSALWAGYCAALETQDFARRAWLPLSGWPIGAEDVASYYDRAAAAMGVAPRTDLAPESGLDPSQLQVGRWTFAPDTQRFIDAVPALAAMPGVDVLTEASAVEIVLSRGHDRVSELVVRTVNGREGRIGCRHLVLACGGIETPRLLLTSNRQLPGGIGNVGGMVGRCFMEHPHRIVPGLRLRQAELIERSARRLPDAAGSDEMLNFALPVELRDALGLLGARAHAFRFAAMTEGDAPLLGLMMEQAPDPASRVTLSDRTDRVGMLLARLDWRLNALDQRSFATTARLVTAALAQAGLADIRTDEDAAGTVGYCCHQMGTTRMSADAVEGVVDDACRVHGIDNLHIAGASVFPTSSWANPTFTLLALTLRLADTLRTGLTGHTPAETANLVEVTA